MAVPNLVAVLMKACAPRAWENSPYWRRGYLSCSARADKYARPRGESR
jgi:hypothetical protein